jgi:hypothetical protein
MSAWKQFTTKDVTITPFTADKGFNYTGNSITGSTVGINIYGGRNVNYTSSANIQTGFEYSSSANSIYNSAKQLYYTNYLTQSTGDVLITASVLPGVTKEDDYYYGPINSPRFENYLQSSLQQNRYFPTSSGNNITTISVPTKLYGEKIIPTTFEFSYTGSGGQFTGNGILLKDDGEGNIISGSENTIVGQIFYSHGTIVLTTGSNIQQLQDIGYDVNTTPANLLNTSISFSSSLTLYEQQYKCTILENEFGNSLNPTLLTSSIEGAINDSYYPFTSGSFFSPYVTSVGLYNEAKQLVAVGKLSFPVPISQYTDTTIIVNFDV